MFSGIGSVIFGWIMWRVTGSLVLGAIIAVVAWPLLFVLLRLPFLLLAALRDAIVGRSEPDVPLTVLNKCAAPDGKGLRIVLAVQNAEQPPQTPEELALLEKTLAASLKKLCQKNRDFKFKYMHYLDNDLPLEVYVSGYKRAQVKVFKHMRKQLAAENFAIGADNQDVFYHTAVLSADGKGAGPTVSLTLAFDTGIPKAPAAGQPEESGFLAVPVSQLRYDIAFSLSSLSQPAAAPEAGS